MKDKVLVYAIVISLGLHLAAVGVIGRASALRFNSAQAVASPQALNVDLVGAPDEDPKPEPVTTVTDPDEPQPTPQTMADQDYNQPQPENTRVAALQGARPGGAGTRPAGNPGGRLNVGSTSANGDLGGNWSGGHTPTGWVPGSDSGEGKGSGNSPGEGTPEPPKAAAEGPSEKPAPAPAVTKFVNERICTESGLLVGDFCKNSRNESFAEDNQPTRKCDRCKAPEPEHKSRVADRANPELTRDTRLTVPSLVDEGLSVTVQVAYTVTSDGDVIGVEVTRSSGNRAVDKAVVSAASGLKYKPAVQDGVARSVKMSRTYKINT